jgi:hypothetical protein
MNQTDSAYAALKKFGLGRFGQGGKKQEAPSRSSTSSQWRAKHFSAAF